jgi:hypothetical protein
MVWLRRVLLSLAVLYGSWMGMMLVHEAGHVLHALVSGGRVERVVMPLAGFSRTDVRPNPHPHFVAWGGAIWGCVVPLLLLSAWRVLRLRWRALVQFFAGFCLIANGAYLASGMLLDGGDAADLRRFGTPASVLIAFGALAVPAGLLLWHRLGSWRDYLNSPASRGEG